MLTSYLIGCLECKAVESVKWKRNFSQWNELLTESATLGEAERGLMFVASGAIAHHFVSPAVPLPFDHDEEATW
jgi:hypothetical protein